MNTQTLREVAKWAGFQHVIDDVIASCPKGTSEASVNGVIDEKIKRVLESDAGAMAIMNRWIDDAKKSPNPELWLTNLFTLIARIVIRARKTINTAILSAACEYVGRNKK